MAFNKTTGNQKLHQPWVVLLLVLTLAAMGYVISVIGLTAAAGFIALPIIIFFLLVLFHHPKTGVIAYLVAAFCISYTAKIITGIPLGLSMDILLLLTLLAIIFRKFYEGVDWRPADSPITWVLLGWFILTLLYLFNPEARSMVAWFYAMRAVALYPLLTAVIVLLVFNKHKHLNTFLKIWAIFTILSALKSIQQKYIGVDPFEQQWLSEGAATTHVLFGKLRAFGLYNDAGVFGAAMGHALVVFGAAGLDAPTRSKKILFFTAAFLGLIGLVLSGTRGALAVPAMGVLVYLLLKKNIKLFVTGILALILAFSFLKFTTIGNSVYEINRMRTALNPEDESLQVRLENQKKLAKYLDDKPFGGGIGSAGSWGKRFSPGTLLAETPTDSWYVRIWAEMGIVGLILHLTMLFYILIAGSRIVYNKIHNKELNGIFAGIMGGYFGIMVASYGNQILGQLPIGQTLFIGIAFVFISPKIQKEIQEK
ncbi:MAG: O-antigen ligase family protein [Bacteroidota bacterium]